MYPSSPMSVCFEQFDRPAEENEKLDRNGIRLCLIGVDKTLYDRPNRTCDRCRSAMVRPQHRFKRSKNGDREYRGLLWVCDACWAPCPQVVNVVWEESEWAAMQRCRPGLSQYV
jgi:hypothetical protein